MQCPYCQADKDSLKVIDSRTCEGGRAIRRRRECLKCERRFTTYERVEETTKLMVIKKDGRRVPWDRQKILTGLERACFKRPVPEETLMRLTDDVEERIFQVFDREVPTNEVGQLVADRLRAIDSVAYVRFASVYKQFKTLDELVEEAKAVLDAKRFEDPGQGRLFLEEQARAAANQNGSAATSPSERRAPRSAPRPARLTPRTELTPGESHR